jgi:hypothetical protein
MASAGTLLSDLDSKSPVLNKDDDLVNKILADMNMPSSANPIMTAPPPPSGNTNRVIQSPNPNTVYPMSADPSMATAHLIGKEYPSTADFANLMHAPSYSHGGLGYASVAPQQMALPQPTLVETKVNLYSDVIAQMKQPILVAIIIFLVSLPILNVLIGHYVPSLLRIGGDLTTAGMVVKSLIGGFLFWFIQKVLVPLMV